MCHLLVCVHVVVGCAIRAPGSRRSTEVDNYFAQTVQHTNDNIEHKFQEPGCQKTLRSTQWHTQDFRMGGIELPQAPRGEGGGIWGGSIPLPTGGRV